MHYSTGAFLGAALALGACGKAPEVARAPAADTATKMAGMQMGMAGKELIPVMQHHLDSLAAMTPAQLAEAVTAHEDLSSRLMDGMGTDMRSMNMTPDSAWTALSDSVRRDLADLPALSGDVLKNRFTAHIGRMRRLMAMHETMVKM